MRGGDHHQRGEFLVGIRPWGQRYGDDKSAVRQLPCRREHRAHEGFRPGHHGSRSGHQREQQDPCLQLAGQVPELADVPLPERPPGGEREHRPAGEPGPHVGGRPPQRAERPVFRGAQRRDGAREPQHRAWLFR